MHPAAAEYTASRKLLLAEALFELSHTTTGVEDLLLAGVEGVTGRTYV